MHTRDLSVKAVFDRALEMDSAVERQAYLDAACAEAPELRQKVEALLEAYQEAGSFLEAPAAVLAATVDEPTHEGAGTLIGPYKLLEPIGEGGFGVVYVAEQQQPLRRRVALKVLKAGMDTRQVVARFEAERQALALMEHPNIAHVFDGGETSSGRPYFVMELVKGLPITEFCDQDRLSVRKRLGLFITICQAVQHAHQKGIIHRDLKPSNVMVTLHDGTPVVKIIDFGIAKALGQRLSDKTLVTGFTQMIGTPLYMSPEQAELSGLDVDTRSDIYSLGVMLYELLTGTTPFDKERLRAAGYDELRRIIREEEPPKPSTRISTLGQAATTVSTKRQSDPQRLSRLFRGELDWIVMKALEKDRNRRYESASAFAADVQRYLTDEPVEACPPSAVYRFRKFGRRNRRLLATGSAFVTLLGLGVVISLWQAVRANQEREQAVAARQAAVQAQHQTRQALDEMSSMVIEDLLSRQKVLTEAHKRYLRKALEAYEEFTADTGRDEPSRYGVASAHLHIARIRQRLEPSPDAATAFRQAIALLRELVADFPALAQYRRDLAISRSWLGSTLQAIGQLQEAERAYAEAITDYERLAADFPQVAQYRAGLASCRNILGNLLAETARPQEGEAAIRAAIAVTKQLIEDFPDITQYRRDLTGECLNLGKLLQIAGRWREAETVYRDALVQFEKLATESSDQPDDREGLARCQNNLGVLLSQTGRPRDAEAAIRSSLAIEKQLAADYPAVPGYRSDLASRYYELGILFLTTARPVEAEGALRDAVQIQKQLIALFPTVHEYRRKLANSLIGLGGHLSYAGRPAEAEAVLHEAIALTKQLAADFPNVPEYRSQLALSHNNLGEVLRALERLPEAEAECRAALALSQGLAADFPTVAQYRELLAMQYTNLGALLKPAGKVQEAEAGYRAALALYEPLIGDYPAVADYQFKLAATLGNLGRLLLQRKELKAARELLERALPHHQAALRAYPHHPGYRDSYVLNRCSLTATLVDLGDHSAAAQTVEQVVEAVVQPARDFNEAACLLAGCVPLAEKDAKLPPDKRRELARKYADRAVELVRQAVRHGYKDVESIKKDSALDPLRARADFQKLLAELEAQRNP
jgi:serine/threonine protein kinase/tetratricopeptide (TPR) repeat protein